MRRLAIACCAVALAANASGANAQHTHELAYVATLNGASQSPLNESAGVGSARIMIDLVFFTIRVQADFRALAGAVTSAQLHGATAIPVEGLAGAITQVPSFPEFPSGVTAGTYDQTFNLAAASSYNPAFITASGGTVSRASNELFQALSAGRTYFNLATTAFADGEIRGFLLPVPKADFDFNGVVAGPDLDVWRESFNVEHHGDASGDGLTTGEDFLLWQQQLGAVASLGGGHGHSRAVPEPTAAALAAVAALGCEALRSRHKARGARTDPLH